jgi:hypothetical protein
MSLYFQFSALARFMDEKGIWLEIVLVSSDLGETGHSISQAQGSRASGDVSA